MGFIPILVTLGGALLLFFMVVNYHLKTKKNQIIQLQMDVYEGLVRLEHNEESSLVISGAELKNLDAKYASLKQGLKEKHLLVFENEVRQPYRRSKLSAAEYNKLIKTKPYSFVAKVMGHHPV